MAPCDIQLDAALCDVFEKLITGTPDIRVPRSNRAKKLERSEKELEGQRRHRDHRTLSSSPPHRAPQRRVQLGVGRHERTLPAGPAGRELEGEDDEHGDLLLRHPLPDA